MHSDLMRTGLSPSSSSTETCADPSSWILVLELLLVEEDEGGKEGIRSRGALKTKGEVIFVLWQKHSRSFRKNERLCTNCEWVRSNEAKANS